MILTTLLLAGIYLLFGDKLEEYQQEDQYLRNKTWNPAEYRSSVGQV